MTVYSVIKKIHFTYNTLALISSEFSALHCSHQLRDPPRARLELWSWSHECFFFSPAPTRPQSAPCNLKDTSIIYPSYLFKFVHSKMLRHRKAAFTYLICASNTSQFLIVNQLQLAHKIALILSSTPNLKLGLVNQALSLKLQIFHPDHCKPGMPHKNCSFGDAQIHTSVYLLLEQ